MPVVARMVDFGRIEACTFDCYGTLIDWETGISRALRPILDAHGVRLEHAALLSLYGEVEAEIQAEPYRTYADVLADVVRRFGARLGFAATDTQAASLPASLPRWPPFADSVAALQRLKSRFKLGILSNVDDALFAESAALLQVEFDWVVTAQQVGSYKPNPRNFERLLATLDLPPQRILHVAQSLFHDIIPAKQCGIPTVWINRRGEHVGVSPEWRARAQPNLETSDLASLADRAGL